MPLRAGGINFHFPYEDAPRERREVRPQPCPGWESPQGQLLPVHTHVCSRMRVHMHVLHERAHTHTHVCVCKHMHMNACKHRLQTYSHRCLHMCVIPIQACNTGVHLHVLATACTCLQPFVHAFNAYMYLHSCTLAHATCACSQHMDVHSCILMPCNTCMPMLAQLHTLATRARLHTLATHACACSRTLATRACLHICTHSTACTCMAHTRVWLHPRVPPAPPN